jgi:hypothetical protein
MDRIEPLPDLVRPIWVSARKVAYPHGYLGRDKIFGDVKTAILNMPDRNSCSLPSATVISGQKPAPPDINPEPLDQRLIQELPDQGRGRCGVGFQKEMASVQDVRVHSGQGRQPRLDFGDVEEGVVLPHSISAAG